jgi:hypothetical protein
MTTQSMVPSMLVWSSWKTQSPLSTFCLSRRSRSVSTRTSISTNYTCLTFVWGHVSTRDHFAGVKLATPREKLLKNLSAQVRTFFVGGDELGVRYRDKSAIDVEVVLDLVGVTVMQPMHCRERIIACEQAHVGFQKLWRTSDNIVPLALSQRIFQLPSLPLFLFGGMEPLVLTVCF